MLLVLCQLSNNPFPFPSREGVYPSLYPSPWSQNGGADDRRGLLLPFLGHSVCILFLILDLVSDYVGFWSQFGLILPPNLEPKSNQNRSKSHPRCIQNRILFLITFWIDFWWIFDGFSASKSTKNQSKMNQKVNPTSQQPRYRKTTKFGDSSTFFIDFNNFALGLLRSKIYKKWSNIHQKTSLKSIPQLAPIFVPTWLHFGRVLGGGWEPSWLQIAPKADPKNDQKNDHLLDGS